MTWTIKQTFTLLEIIICMTILGMAAITLGWQMKGLLSAHHFQKNVDQILIDLKKCQIIALSDRVDIEMHIEKMGGTYRYQLHCDDPIPYFMKKPMKLKGVEEIRIGKKPIERHVFTIYSSGRIVPTEEISLFQNEERGIAFNFTKSPLIEINNINPL